jgi:predicted nucleic acid-binding protein
VLITIDTSAILAVIGNEPKKERIIELTQGASLIAPSSVYWEVGNALSAMFKRRSIELSVAQKALEIFKFIPIKYTDVSLERTLFLTKTLNIYAYDAYLIQCAEQTESPLLTLDGGLKDVAKKIGIEVMEI